MSERTDPADTRFPARMTFIVRLDASESEGVAGIVEHASTGRKERFRGVEAIREAIAALIQALLASQHNHPWPLR